MSLITLKFRGGYTDRWTDIEEYKNRQQGDLISLLLFIAHFPYFETRSSGKN
jgi:hypothetical protein